MTPGSFLIYLFDAFFLVFSSAFGCVGFLDLLIFLLFFCIVSLVLRFVRGF